MNYDPLVYVFIRYLLIGLVVSLPVYVVIQQLLLTSIWTRFRHHVLRRKKETIFLQPYRPNQLTGL